MPIFVSPTFTIMVEPISAFPTRNVDLFVTSPKVGMFGEVLSIVNGIFTLFPALSVTIRVYTPSFSINVLLFSVTPFKVAVPSLNVGVTLV